MRRFLLPALPLFLSLTIGCAELPSWPWLDHHSETAQVPPNAFGTVPGPTPPARVSYAPAPIEAAARVDPLGQKLVSANPQMGLRPVFLTVGDPRPWIKHVGTSQVIISQGLVKQCSSEGQLAAVLCRELGKMVSEREALAGAQARRPEREPPMEVRIGNDSSSMFGRTSDMTRQAELAKYDPERRREMAPPLPPPDPQALAVAYLKKAGFSASNLDAVAPLQSAAEK
jgi:hypothetical protein